MLTFFFFGCLVNLNIITIDELALHLMSIDFLKLSFDFLLICKLIACTVTLVLVFADDILSEIRVDSCFVLWIWFRLMVFDHFGIPLFWLKYVVILDIIIKSFFMFKRRRVFKYVFTRSVRVFSYFRVFVSFNNLSLVGFMFSKYIVTLVGWMDSGWNMVGTRLLVIWSIEHFGWKSVR